MMVVTRLAAGVLVSLSFAGAAVAQVEPDGIGLAAIHLPGVVAPVQPTGRAAIENAETNLSLAVNVQHLQYSEQYHDSENGFVPGFTLGGSYLRPGVVWPVQGDLYDAVSYQFNDGSLTYHGSNLLTNAPLSFSHATTMNRFEARIGMGLPVSQTMIIPFLAAGYQTWNRNIDNETYRGILLGGGLRFDAALAPRTVVYVEAEGLGILGTHINGKIYDPYLNANLAYSSDMGSSVEERLGAGVDEAVFARTHLFLNGYWSHFNWAGSKANYGVYEPLSSSTEFGLNLGASYAF
jgi:hypothetical protein